MSILNMTIANYIECQADLHDQPSSTGHPEKTEDKVNTNALKSTDILHDNVTSADDDRAIVWFDIDNTLYPYTSGVEQSKTEKLYEYLLSLGFNKTEADALRARYIKEYGLVLRGLLVHHKIDPVDFDERTDLSVPVEEMLRPDPALLKLLEDLDGSKVRIWAFTNAHLKVCIRYLHLRTMVLTVEPSGLLGLVR